MPQAEDAEIIQIEVGLIQNFSEILVCRITSRCALVDPAFEVDRLYHIAAERGLSVESVLLTHAHPDHIDGVPEVIRRSGPVPVYIGAREAEVLTRYCQREGVSPSVVALQGGEQLTIGRLRIEVLATPGHTAHGLSYYLPDLGSVLTGDTLFVGGCGRTNFPGSDARTLYRSLHRLAGLPEETRIYPGHDYGPTPTSTLAWELQHNPCLRCPDEDAFIALARRR